ncbi:TPA: hypothetical protein DCR49_05115 [Candidatus Delongbacteria bacterium]|nr:hypothetical protein [Candidatus Delongbacteria bacterium]
MRKLLWAVSGLIILAGCSEEITYKAENNSVYEQYYADTTVVLVKSRYRFSEYTDGELSDEDTYSANTLFMKKYDSSSWLFVGILNEDSNIRVVKWNIESKLLYLNYSDSVLFVKDLRNLINDSIKVYDSSDFLSTPVFITTLSADEAYIDSLNNGRWYKKYEDWINGL